MATENREIKSTVFADLFGGDELVGKKNFLSLYNALHGTRLTTGGTEVVRRTIPQAVYRSLSNDVSMEVGGRLIVLVEHQSRLNANMPLRFLEYYVHLLHGIVPHEARYRERLYRIPAPEFYVLYNGKAPAEREREQRLSEAYLEGAEEACVRGAGEDAEGCYLGAVREAMAEGVLEERREQKAIEDAQSFLAKGVSVKVVAKSLGMDIATVEELAARATV